MTSRWLAGVAAALLAEGRLAHAYIDPGSAGILMQALVGAVAAAGLAAGVWWSRLRALARRLLERRPGGGGTP